VVRNTVVPNAVGSARALGVVEAEHDLAEDAEVREVHATAKPRTAR
jgi:hypothetical protein